MAVSTRLITYADSLTMPEDRLEEIVNGEQRRMPPATDRHGFLLKRLTEILERQLDPAEFLVLPAEFGLGIRRDPVLTYRVPDRMLFRTGVLRQDRATKADNDPYIWQAPDLIVECLSPAGRKGPLLELLSDYEAIGVPEIWLFEPKRTLFTAYLLIDGKLQPGVETPGGIVSPACAPAVKVDLAELWRAFEHGLFD